MRLENKSAIVTGGARGIGYAICKRFLEDGARVILADSADKAGREAIEELAVYGEIQFVHADVSERLDVRNMAAAAIEAHGDIDILVNNAAIMQEADFLDLKEDEFDRIIATNLKGPFLCAQTVARHMVENVEADKPAGSIINMSSIYAEVSLANQLPYVASKGGVRQMTKAMALALAPHGIRVNAIGPGSILTSMHAANVADKETRERVLTRTPLGRVGEPLEIAAVASFLASNDASYLTGETIYVDGGRLCLNYLVDKSEEE